MKYYTEYKTIKAKAKRETTKRIRQRCSEVRNDWDKFRETWLYRDYLTANQKTKTKAEQQRIIIDKITKEETKHFEGFVKLCDQIAQAEPVRYIRIHVEWISSRTWGSNPHAELWTSDGYYTGRASGCGYDKLSAATAEALNQSKGVLKFLYNNWEKALRKNKDATLRDVLGYGSGYSRPYFEGGVGYSCHHSILQRLGFVGTWNEGRSWDCMEYNLKGAK